MAGLVGCGVAGHARNPKCLKLCLLDLSIPTFSGLDLNEPRTWKEVAEWVPGYPKGLDNYQYHGSICLTWL